MIIFRGLRVALTLVAVCAVSSGCATWREFSPVAQPQSATQTERQLRVTLAQEQRLVLYGVVISDQIVHGISSAGRLEIPLSAVQRLERRRFDPVRTSLAVVGLGAGVLTFFALLVLLANPQEL